jgi:RNA polymerase sigma-B factor
MSLARIDESPVPAAARPPSDYADQMPQLQRYAAMSPDDPRRGPLREDLILAFLPVVDHLARRHASSDAGLVDDLTQAGRIALIAAIDRWDPDLAQGEFIGYLVPCVRGEMLRWFRDRTWAVRVPRRLNELSAAISRATGPLSQELGRAPRPSELAAHLGTSVDEVIEALHARTNQRADTLDATDSDTGLAPTERLGALDAALDLVEHRAALRPLLDRLPDRERTILVLRFFGERSQTQIAQELGISQMHVSRLLARTLTELRRQLAAQSQ